MSDSRSYDSAGNTLRSLLGSYAYDASNRMAGFAKAGTQAEYDYNSQGERIRKRVNGVTTRYRYGEGGRLMGEYDVAGRMIREYVYLGDQPVAQMAQIPLSVYYLHTDHLGAVVKATDGGKSSSTARPDSRA